jgi:single-strand DNA-binding protein
MPDNTVTIVGNVTRDPELRYTPSGAANARFGVAVNRRWRDPQSNDWKESVSFFDVVCWREMADNVCESLSKGTRIVVTGRLDQQSWEDNDGNKKSKVEILAEEIGPSLRWASAAITKNERRSPDGGGGGQGGGGYRPAANAPSGPPAQGGGYAYDEEPF